MSDVCVKRCRKCGKELPLDQFNRDKQRSDGLRSYCKKCNGDVSKATYLRRRAAHIKKAHEWRRNHPDKTKAIVARYAKKYPRRWRKYDLKKYGLSEKGYAMLFERQHGLCAICNHAEVRMSKGRVHDLSVDHDHETGVIRALLCKSCNVLIGNARDNPSILESAANYLKAHQAKMRT